jgi:hypothetical protein
LPGVAQTVGTARLTGVVGDTRGGVLPGVTVTVSGPGLREKAVTDENGRFAIEGLMQGRPATYTVTAELAGFQTRTLDSVAAVPGGVVDLAITLEIGCVQEVLYVDPGLLKNLQSSDGVFLLRIESMTPARHWKASTWCGDSPEYVAPVIETIKGARPAAGTLRFVLFGSGHRYETGGEYIAFLAWEPSIGRYRVLMPGYLVPVRSGWVEWDRLPTIGIPQGSPVSDVIEALRSAQLPGIQDNPLLIR